MNTSTAYRRLIDRLDRNAPPEEQWRLLMAAHVAGQLVLRLHWDSHCRMLALAWRQRDIGEVAGQLLRLALVPVGHALQRLPAGNVGRATVNAFRPMQPPPEVAALLRWARGAD
ncbi:DUF3703 domain-containing protein [Ramlibacter tataouinensis]|uniref:DUF3703 domain-containing protein n=1 Tax=Ramlibacter tataouinensis TaxID=94132 RepID=UPI0022F38B59|nr:DUF3703 domain-containing protein [Ramlibacter tataouinensis]WBY00088.1 DUF3703 domain-containing protein [Ramlibacter tataouinensis]